MVSGPLVDPPLERPQSLGEEVANSVSHGTACHFIAVYRYAA